MKDRLSISKSIRFLTRMSSLDDLNLIARVTSLENNMAEMKVDVTDLKTGVANLQSYVTNLQSDVTNLKTGVTTLQSDVTEIKSAIKMSLWMFLLTQLPVWGMLWVSMKK